MDYIEIAKDMWNKRREFSYQNPNFPQDLPYYLRVHLDHIDSLCKIYNGSQGDNCLSSMETIATCIECYCMMKGY